MTQLIFLLGGFVLSMALLPTVMATVPPPAATSLLYTTVLAAFTVAFVMDRQRISAAGTGLNATLCAIIAAQAVLS